MAFLAGRVDTNTGGHFASCTAGDSRQPPPGLPVGPMLKAPLRQEMAARVTSLQPPPKQDRRFHLIPDREGSSSAGGITRTARWAMMR